MEERCESGRVTLTGSGVAKRVERDVGETAWAIPAVADVQNNVNVATRRRGRPRDVESAAGGAKPQAGIASIAAPPGHIEVPRAVSSAHRATCFTRHPKPQPSLASPTQRQHVIHGSSNANRQSP